MFWGVVSIRSRSQVSACVEFLCRFSLRLHGFLLGLRYPHTSQKHAKHATINSCEMPCDVMCNSYMVPCDGLAPLQGIFPRHAQCSWDKLWIHHNLDLDKVLTTDKSVNEYSYLVSLFSGPESTKELSKLQPTTRCQYISLCYCLIVYCLLCLAARELRWVSGTKHTWKNWKLGLVCDCESIHSYLSIHLSYLGS